jgi:hypothetical protein
MEIPSEGTVGNSNGRLRAISGRQPRGKVTILRKKFSPPARPYLPSFFGWGDDPFGSLSREVQTFEDFSQRTPLQMRALSGGHSRNFSPRPSEVFPELLSRWSDRGCDTLQQTAILRYHVLICMINPTGIDLYPQKDPQRARTK